MTVRRALALTLALVAGCAGPPPVAPARIEGPGGERATLLRIGVVLPLSGSEAELGREASQGVELAREAFEEASGAKVSIAVRDDASLPGGMARAVEELAEGGALAILGEVSSSRTSLAAEAAERAAIALVAPTSTAANLTRGRAWTVTTVPDDEQAGAAAASLFAPRSKVGVTYYPSSAYSKDLVEGFARGAEERGATVAQFVALEPGPGGDASTVAERMASEGVAAVFAPIFAPDVPALARALATRGSFVLVGADGWDSAELVSDGAKLDGARYVGHFAPDAPWAATRALVDRHAKRLRGAPEAIEACFYDATLVVLEAALRARAASRAAVRGEIAKTRERAGATGVLTLTAGRVQKDMPVLRIDHGRPVFDGVVKAR